MQLAIHTYTHIELEVRETGRQAGGGTVGGREGGSKGRVGVRER